MKVMKFGGSSVGSAEAILRVSGIVSAGEEKTVVVVSAMRGVTDSLLELAKIASEGSSLYKEKLADMVSMHINTIDACVRPSEKKRVIAAVEALIEELSNILKGVYLIRDLSSKTNDTIVGYGERLSSTILSGVIEDAVWVDSRDLIKTYPHFNRHLVDFEKTNELIANSLGGESKVIIAPGFISSDVVTGDNTTLGRGGSDYTAAIIAAAMNASVLEIWTDVDGFLTADPRMVSSAYVIDKLSYVEAIELCNFGAKVIFPPTIYPAFHKNIPIKVKNTFNPKSEGTFISNEKSESIRSSIRGISSISNTCLLTIQGFGFVGVPGIDYRAFKVLAKAGISVFFVSQAASENNISIGVDVSNSAKALELLDGEFAREIEQGEINKVKCECGLATVAIVGDDMKHTVGVAGKLFNTLGRNGINVIACAQGASETNISFVIKMESLKKALNVIHDSFFLSEYQIMNVFIAGVGGVGGSFIEQLHMQQPQLQESNSLQVRVVGISNSKNYIIDKDGLDLSNYKQLLADAENDREADRFVEKIKELNLFNSVFVDCTANKNIAALYQDLLEHNISVVAANKTAASSSYEAYSNLKNTARRRGVKFLFETNVGAGLPIINTINALRNSGDKILKIEAVVSGTINYIFNTLSASKTLSQAVMMAKEAGYAEPDPRLDLDGSDVARKIVILAREAGYVVEYDDVKRVSFIPEELFEGSVEKFWENLPKVDASFEQKRKELESKGLKLRFVAKFENGEAEVKLREVASDSPFYDLEGSNNVIALTTERYKQYPMQIKGYGAGAEVTAAGVFADLISIANIR